MKKMTIGRKLFLCFGAALALTAGIGLVALTSFSSLEAQVKKMVNVNSRKMVLAGYISTAASDVVGGERGILLRAYMNDYSMVEAYKGQTVEAMARLQKNVDEFATLVETAEGRSLLSKISQVFPEMRQRHGEIVAFVRSARSLGCGEG